MLTRKELMKRRDYLKEIVRGCYIDQVSIDNLTRVLDVAFSSLSVENELPTVTLRSEDIDKIHYAEHLSNIPIGP